jgi:hypothetical protein
MTQNIIGEAQKSIYFFDSPFLYVFPSVVRKELKSQYKDFQTFRNFLHP